MNTIDGYNTHPAVFWAILAALLFVLIDVVVRRISLHRPFRKEVLHLHLLPLQTQPIADTALFQPDGSLHSADTGTLAQQQRQQEQQQQQQQHATQILSAISPHPLSQQQEEPSIPLQSIDQSSLLLPASSLKIPSTSSHQPETPLRLTATKPTLTGHHHLTFPDGTTYAGEFLQGQMHGRGVLIWPNGERYEGEWQHGLQHGQGAFISSHNGDANGGGAAYYGSWKDGRQHGRGVLTPTTTRTTVLNGKSRENRGENVVYLRTYNDGILLEEVALEVVLDPGKRKQKKKEKQKQQVQVQEKKESDKKKQSSEQGGSGVFPPSLSDGEHIYKGHRSYELMRELQLGVMYSIAQAGLGGPSYELKSSDFTEEIVQYFPAASDLESFKWKDYAPKVFHKLRQAFGVDNSDYLLSVTGTDGLKELVSPGQSGCIFFISNDDRFFIKSIRKGEMSLLLSLIKQYHNHVVHQPDTLLVPFFGVHRVSPFLGRNARFVVMGNVLPSGVRLHRKYDLKGSNYKRTVGEERMNNDPGAVLKDLNLDLQLELTPDRYARLMHQLHADCDLLEAMKVMDYSLLLGVHFIKWGSQMWVPPYKPWPLDSIAGVAETLQIENLSRGSGSIYYDALPTLNLPIISNYKESDDDVLQQHDDEGRADLQRSMSEVLQSLANSRGELTEEAANVLELAYSSRKLAQASAASASASAAASAQTSPRKVTQYGSATNTNTNLLHTNTTPSNHEEEESAVKLSNSNVHQRQELPKSRSTYFSQHLSREAARAHEKESGCSWAVPALAVQHLPDGTTSKEPVVLYFGIIDFLQDYNVRKRAEHVWKVALHGTGVSVSDPKAYRKRFETFVKTKVFKSTTS